MIRPPSFFPDARRQRGFSLLEIMISSVLLLILYLAMTNALSFIRRQTSISKQKTFAAQKAIQMMEELRGLIDNTSEASIGTLDDYDNGVSVSYILSTKAEVADPGDPVSGNRDRRYVRRVNVIAVPNEPLARRVYVRVYLAEDMSPLAEIVSVLRTVTTQNVPTQVFDVYVLALENVPGWWSALSTLRPTFDNVLADLQTRCPNLEIRSHWITRLSYGRDPYYTPFINETTRSDSLTASNLKVYYYPGNVDGHDSGADFTYYVENNISGRHNNEGTTISAGNAYTKTTALGGSIADQYNHAVRYPDEEALYNEAVASAAALGQTAPEISLRMLWERMNNNPELIKNALIVNLHGELVPFPPVRNYSDPAKVPTVSSNVRVVTHPENLCYNAGSSVTLRVYPYTMFPDSFTTTSYISTVSVLLTSTQIATNRITVQYLNAASSYYWTIAPSTMAEISFPPGTTCQTLITLYRSPLRHEERGTFGLDSGDRLYGLEYIPCLVSSGTQFRPGLRDLSDPAANMPKNTARWRIILTTGSVPTGILPFETRIGSDTTMGTALSSPTNLSRSYCWVGSSPPATEQYQFQGDPRHMPYVDVKIKHQYNWFFTSINLTDYPEFTQATTSLWNSAANYDVPKFFHVLRTGLMKSGSIWNSITGYSFYYTGIGGEIGYDSSNSFTSGIQIVQIPWVTNGGTTVSSVNEIVSSGYTYNYYRLIAKTNNQWYGRFWIGELYPDDAASTWETAGNLNVGSGQYYRAEYDDVTSLSNPQKRTDTKGCASFFNGNLTASGSTYFNHTFPSSPSDYGTITTSGTAIANDFNFPLLTSMYATRPFRLDDSSSQPPEWGLGFYIANRTLTATQQTIYTTDGNASYNSSAIIRFATAAASTAIGYSVVNGLSPQSSFGSAEIAKMCVLSMMRAFMTGGQPSISVSPIPQLPLVSISSPNATDELSNPSTINVVWGSSWTRWDSQKYTDGYPNNYSSTQPVSFNIKYSSTNARTWSFVQDNTAASAGTLDSSAAHAISTTSYIWNVSFSTQFPKGTYILRVEGYRDGLPLHYSYQQRRLYIKR